MYIPGAPSRRHWLHQHLEYEPAVANTASRASSTTSPTSNSLNAFSTSLPVTTHQHNASQPQRRSLTISSSRGDFQQHPQRRHTTPQRFVNVTAAAPSSRDYSASISSSKSSSSKINALAFVQSEP